MERRTFLRCLGCSAMATAIMQTNLLPKLLGGLQEAHASGLPKNLSSIEARYYKKLKGGGIECGLCPRHCIVADSERGFCGTRENHHDKYYTLVYGLPCLVSIDPIEKKPLFHFYPGTTAFSLATAGCNVDCKFCQNWDISQSQPEQTDNINLSPAQVVAACRQKDVPAIAYTYSEPTVFYEYMYDIAELGHKQSIRSVMITNGFMESEPRRNLLSVLDAVKVDLKAIRPDYYRNIVRGQLKPVLDAIIQIKKSGVWLELVYLIVPTLNDTPDEFRELARWIKSNIGTDTPLHFSRFYPQYLLKNLPPTPQITLETAHSICRGEGLEYVYLGNLPGHPAESTYCPQCGKLLIERRGYLIYQKNLKGNRCYNCNRVIPGLF
ncbi:MAG: AmmeMemoRadiSam system radical SAM enzyme [candidate division Zixibacteria bacterium]|nr:AmmeMemoRadiSam system radical SAM enzyme [candidate division Zixibacteria bacterium]